MLLLTLGYGQRHFQSFPHCAWQSFEIPQPTNKCFYTRTPNTPQRNGGIVDVRSRYFHYPAVLPAQEKPRYAPCETRSSLRCEPIAAFQIQVLQLACATEPAETDFSCCFRLTALRHIKMPKVKPAQRLCLNRSGSGCEEGRKCFTATSSKAAKCKRGKRRVPEQRIAKRTPAITGETIESQIKTSKTGGVGPRCSSSIGSCARSSF